MRKEVKIQSGGYAMPVLIIAAYDENQKVELMNAAGGMACGSNQIALFISSGHKTTQTILKSKVFSFSIADEANIVPADFVGIATGNSMPDKFAKSGLTAVPGESGAPVIEDFPVCYECELLEEVNTDNVHCIVGKVVRVTADEKVLGENGQVDPEKLHPLIFNQFSMNYYKLGEQAGIGWKEGKALMD